MRTSESQFMDEWRKKQNELQIRKEAWLNERIKAAAPDWPFDYKRRFEYNTAYDFWRAAYYGHSRDQIKAYETLIDNLDVGSEYEFVIWDYHLYVRPNEKSRPNRYQSMIDNIPLLAPHDPEQVYEMKRGQPDIDWIAGSFCNRLKSQVFTCYEKPRLLLLERFYTEKLGPDGYSSLMLKKGRGRGMSYALVITHESETPDACLELMSREEWTILDEKPKTKAAKKPSGKQKPAAPADLDAREQELLKELEAIRKQKNS